MRISCRRNGAKERTGQRNREKITFLIKLIRKRIEFVPYIVLSLILGLTCFGVRVCLLNIYFRKIFNFVEISPNPIYTLDASGHDDKPTNLQNKQS